MHRLRRSMGHENGLWPVLLLLAAAVLVPTACLLWFMNQVMRNERLAVRQRLADAYLGNLTAARERLERYWADKAAELDRFESQTPGSRVFAELVRSGLAGSVICYDARGRLLYPALLPAPKADPVEHDPLWVQARSLEQTPGKMTDAAGAYSAIVRMASDPNLAARALQAQARCLVRAGRKEAAIRLIVGTLSSDRFRRATDLQGRLVAADAELLALQLMGSPEHAGFEETAARLHSRLDDYDNPALQAAQRLFLMKQLQALPLAAGHKEFPTLRAEELAAGFVETAPHPSKETVLRLSPLPGVWQFGSSGGRILALFRTEDLQKDMRDVLSPLVPVDVRITATSPGQELPREQIFQSVAAGEHLPRWQLVLSLRDPELFNDTADRQVTLYLWTGILGVAAMAILAAFIVRALRRQVRLTRLKNDLIATVSHELKTPLSSMRLLVDTLLDAKRLDEPQVREYLDLVAKENARLSRLIENFLAFSRMEQGREKFDRKEVPPENIVRAAAEAVRERFEASGCRFDVQASPGLPAIHADPDACVTVLLNLLDNAYKYSEGDRQISLRAYAQNGNVCFAVADNGIGLSPRETRRIFERFYQVDRRLSRSTGGCGLGLSIVKFIVDAHDGEIRVASRPGQGSTFTVLIPSVLADSGVRR